MKTDELTGCLAIAIVAYVFAPWLLMLGLGSAGVSIGFGPCVLLVLSLRLAIRAGD